MNSWTRDGRVHFGVGIEDTFVPQEYPGRRALDEYALTGHYVHWEQDLDLVAASGAELIRWGIPWYRVEPQPGEFDWSWVDRVVERMTSLGLTCVLDLVHYGTPLWLDFLAPAYPEAVARFGREAARRYSGRVSSYTVLNEPILHAYNGGQLGIWPPETTGHEGFVQLLLALCRGMVRTQEEIRSVDRLACFVHVDAGLLWRGTTTPEPRTLLEERRFAALELTMGRVATGHPLDDYLRANGASRETLRWFRDHACRPDVFGVNYYPAISSVLRTDGRETPLEAGVEGLAELLGAYRERYPGPFALTETSRVGTPEDRTRWLTESTQAVYDLRARGLDICAYFWFPFLGIYDWDYRTGDEDRAHWWRPMGLVDLCQAGDGLERIETPALSRFRDLAESAKRSDVTS